MRPVGIVRFWKINHFLICLSQSLLVTFPWSSGVANQNHLILWGNIFHQLRQVLSQPLWVTFISFRNFLDECLLSLVNIYNRRLQKSSNLYLHRKLRMEWGECRNFDQPLIPNVATYWGQIFLDICLQCWWQSSQTMLLPTRCRWRLVTLFCHIPLVPPSTLTWWLGCSLAIQEILKSLSLNVMIGIKTICET